MVTIVTHCSAEFCTGLGVKRKIGSDGYDDGDNERDCHGDADGDDGNCGDNDDDDDDGDLNLRRAVHLGQGSSGSCGGAKKAKVAKVLQPWTLHKYSLCHEEEEDDDYDDEDIDDNARISCKSKSES